MTEIAGILEHVADKEVLWDYLLHFLIGLVGACTAIYGRRFCRHRNHQIIVTVTLLLIEAVASVHIVG